MKSHKNLHVVAFIAAMMALGAQAARVSSDEILSAVSAWSSANGVAFAGSGTAESAKPVYDDDGTTVLYWIVSMSNGGAVIASPDTDLDLVVSVLEKYDGDLPEGHPLPSILKRDMRNRLAVIANRKASSGTSGRLRLGAAASAPAESNAALDDAISTANAQWAKYGVAEKGGRSRLRGNSLVGGDASPYVRCIVDGFEQGGRYTFWDQKSLKGGEPFCFNAYVTNHVYCGCVATAGAAILQFFNCTNDPGAVVSTNCTYNGKRIARSVTMPGNTDWSILPAALGGTNTAINLPDAAGYDLLGRVAYNMGVLVDMAWSDAASGAFTVDLVKAFKAYGFKNARYVEYSADPETDGAEFMKTIYAQLWCGAPVSLGIRGAPGGHEVVACGYARDVDGDEFCRVFMGWGGSGDNWYKLPKIDDFIQVEDAVTMLSYEDDAVVPVYGETNIPGAELKLPGYVKNGKPVTVTVNEHGYFGVRVPANLANKTIVYEPQSKSITIEPFDSSVIANAEAKLADLDAALPDEIVYRPLNMAFKQTMVSGKAQAIQDGKALLVVSGTPDSERSKLLVDYLYHLNDTTDISNRFVYVYVEADASNAERDGDPSVAVFDPFDFDPEMLWDSPNGVLDYDNFIDYDAYTNLPIRVDSSTAVEPDSVYSSANEIPYVFSADDTTEMTNRLDRVLATGHDLYLRRHSDITLNIQGANIATDEFVSDATGEMKYGTTTAAWACDTYTDIWTNGESVAFSAPGTYTNEYANIIYSCVGWTTNKVSSKRDIANLTNYTAGATATLKFSAGTTNTLTWVWDVTHYRVTTGAYPPERVTDAVTPADSWVARGERMSITAKPTVGAFAFNSWRVRDCISGEPGNDYDYYGSAALCTNATTAYFYVNEPVFAEAIYKRGGTAPTPVSYALNIHSSPADAESRTTPPFTGSYAWGANTSSDNVFKIEPNLDATYVDSSGGVWKCTEIRFEPEPHNCGDGVYQIPSSVSSLDVTVVWKLQKDSPDDPENPPTPTAITITGIARNTDGSWKITVSGAVKDCWYWLYSADGLAAFSSDPWTAIKAVTKEDNPQKAAADGDVEFNATTTGMRFFWRVKGTSKEDGD